uniref:T cell receptor alpha variable 34 n=1 Tax=Suricata suricatta TaxID=37032 RepID=A0A673THE7_SURSU
MSQRMETLLRVLLGILELQVAWVSSQKLEQSPLSLTIQEGEDFTVNCSSSKTLYALHWYRQKNGEGLSFLMVLQKKGEEKSHEKITAKMDEKMQQSSLHITASQPSHSGTYLCAAGAL